MLVRVVLVDINPKMIAAWRESFEENPEVEIVQGSMLDQHVHAYVTPTNAKGSMDGGLDAVLKKHFGSSIEKRVQQEIARLYGGSMPIGRATCVSTGKTMPSYLISTPTMGASSEDISDTLNVALACSAAFQAVHQMNARQPGAIRSVALPGLGANTGKVPVEICADLMWTAYNMFLEHEFASYEEMKASLQKQLGDLGPMGQAKSSNQQKHSPSSAIKQQPPAKPAKQTPSIKTEDLDFDDSE